jgi:uracil-DNA glycosylase family 4
MQLCKVEECQLHGRPRVRFAGNTHADTIFVGESPGRTEENEDRPFCGRAGQLLITNLTLAGIELPSIFVANAAMCLLDKPNLKTKELNTVLKNCRRHLEWAIRDIKPKLIVCLGDIAMKQVTGKTGITKYRGEFMHSDEFDCEVFPTFHPSYCLRSPQHEPTLLQDLRHVRAFQQDGYRRGQTEEEIYMEMLTIHQVLDLKPEFLSIDTETQGMDWLHPHSFMISYSIAWPIPAYGGKRLAGGQVFLYELSEPRTAPDRAVLIEQKEGRTVAQRAIYVRPSPHFNEKMEELRILLEDPDIKKYFFNGNYDLHMIYECFRRAGEVPPVIQNYAMDVQAAAHCYDENVWARPSLESVQKFFTDIPQYNSEFGATHDKANMILVPQDEVTPYACKDAIVTLAAGLELRKRLFHPDAGVVNPWLYGTDVERVIRERRTIEPSTTGLLRYFARFVMPTLKYSMFTMEENGAPIDLEELPRARERISRMIQEEETAAIALIPGGVRTQHMEKGLRLTRTDLIRDTLYSQEGYKVYHVPQTGANAKSEKGANESVSKEARVYIKAHARTPKRAVEFIEHYERWSEYHTLLTRYISGFEKAIRSDGRIHTQYSICGTVTGRLASSNPNMQNNPKRSASAKEIRSLIAAPAGKVLIEIDYSQAELRWMAHCANDPTMRQVYVDGGDIHSKTAAEITEKDELQCSEEEWKKARRDAKSVNFGFIYGMQAKGFKHYARVEFGVDLSLATAEEYRSKFFRLYNKLPDFHRNMINFCTHYGYVVSPYGRVRRLPGIKSHDAMERMRAERQAINTVIQSAASDTALLSLNEIIEKGILDPSKIMPILFVHDSIVFEADEDPAVHDEFIPQIVHEMEHPPIGRFGLSFSIPMIADVQVGRNLAEMDKWNLSTASA